MPRDAWHDAKEINSIRSPPDKKNMVKHWCKKDYRQNGKIRPHFGCFQPNSHNCFTSLQDTNATKSTERSFGVHSMVERSLHALSLLKKENLSKERNMILTEFKSYMRW